MTRPDLAFSYSQPSKFVQYPGTVQLEAADHVLQYVRATYNQGISYYYLGPDKRNKLGGWVDSDFYLRVVISDCLLIGFIRATKTLRKELK
jgi:hypothetical protein